MIISYCHYFLAKKTLNDTVSLSKLDFDFENCNLSYVMKICH